MSETIAVYYGCHPVDMPETPEPLTQWYCTGCAERDVIIAGLRADIVAMQDPAKRRDRDAQLLRYYAEQERIRNFNREAAEERQAKEHAQRQAERLAGALRGLLSDIIDQEAPAKCIYTAPYELVLAEYDTRKEGNG